VKGLSYTGIDDVKISFLYSTLGIEESLYEAHHQGLFTKARNEISAFNAIIIL